MVTLPLHLPRSQLRDLTHEKHKTWSLKRKFLCHWCQKKKLQKTNAAVTFVAKSGANGKIVKVNVGLNVVNVTDGHVIFAQTSNN